MGKKHDLYGVEKIEYGPPGDGVMGGTLQTYTSIKDKTVTIDIPQSEPKKIYTEPNRSVPYRSFMGDPGNVKFSFELYGVPLAELPDFLGGEYVTLDKQYNYPVQEVDIYASLKITQRDTAAGLRLVHYVPYGFVSAGIAGPLTYDDLATLMVTVEANLPVSAVGAEGDPYYIKEEEDS